MRSNGRGSGDGRASSPYGHGFHRGRGASSGAAPSYGYGRGATHNSQGAPIGRGFSRGASAHTAHANGRESGTSYQPRNSYSYNDHRGRGNGRGYAGGAHSSQAGRGHGQHGNGFHRGRGRDHGAIETHPCLRRSDTCQNIVNHGHCPFESFPANSCLNFLEGRRCKFGDDCRYAHPARTKLEQDDFNKLRKNVVTWYGQWMARQPLAGGFDPAAFADVLYRSKADDIAEQENLLEFVWNIVCYAISDESGVDDTACMPMFNRIAEWWLLSRQGEDQVFRTPETMLPLLVKTLAIVGKAPALVGNAERFIEIAAPKLGGDPEFQALRLRVAALREQLNAERPLAAKTDSKSQQEAAYNAALTQQITFRGLNEVPTVRELSEDGFGVASLPYVVLDREIPAGLDVLLDTQFKLLREDFVGPLRDGLFHYRNRLNGFEFDPKNRDVRRFRCFADSITVTPTEGLMFAFTTTDNARKWDSCLLPGNLVALSSDKFDREILLGHVFKPMERKDPVTGRLPQQVHDGPRRFHVQFYNVSFLEGFTRNKQYDMAESAAFFLPYHNVLRSLKVVTLSAPIEAALLYGRVEPPPYMQARPPLKLASTIVMKDGVDPEATADVLDEGAWRECEDWSEEGEKKAQEDRHHRHVLDESQRSAMQHVFASNVACLQGTPGTGKTFVGAKLLQLLLNNWRTVKCGPIVVMCYTNHAVDSVLLQVIDYGVPIDDIVRLGQPKHEALESTKLNPKVRSGNKYIMREMEETLDRIRTLQGIHDAPDFSEGLVDSLIHNDRDSVLDAKLRGEIVKAREELKDVTKALKKLRVEVDDRTYKCSKLLSAAIGKKHSAFDDLVRLCDGNIASIPARRDKLYQQLQAAKAAASHHYRRLAARLAPYDAPAAEDPDCITWLQMSMAECDAYLDNATKEGNDEDVAYFQEQIVILHECIAMNEAARKCSVDAATFERQHNELGVQLTKCLEAQAAVPAVREAQTALANREKQLKGARPHMHTAIHWWRYGYDVVRLGPPPPTVRHVPQPHAVQDAPLDVADALPPQEQRELDDLDDPDAIATIGALYDPAERNHWQGQLQRLQALPRSRDTVREMCHYLLWEAKAVVADKILHSLRLIGDLKDRIQRRKDDARLEVLKQHRIIGATSTTATGMVDVLRRLQPKIVLVEEAAEVLESHVLGVLTPHTEHLILVGDHRQLRPKTSSGKMCKRGLDVSMMERLVRLGAPFKSLDTQRRMHPDISDFTKQFYLRNSQPGDQIVHVKDHPCTALRPIPFGVVDKARFAFIDHAMPEGYHDGIQSPCNEQEAKLALDIARYLSMQCGSSLAQVTILTPYTGQVLTLRQELRSRHANLGRVNIASIDDFQGEENDFIVISLVRQTKPGFLTIDNRACVALSRARRAMYILGNASLIAQCNELWKRALGICEGHGRILKKFPAVCERHGADIGFGEGGRDTFNIRGGCTRLCEFELACGHVCKLMCHADDPTHEATTCKEVCGRARENCTPPRHCDHKCQRLCSAKCGPCNEYVDALWEECGHTAKARCHEKTDGTLPPCKVIVTLPLERCEHEATAPCHEFATETGRKQLQANCRAKCSMPMPCGHVCKRMCHADDPEHEEGMANCQEKCHGKLPTCDHHGAYVCAALRNHDRVPFCRNTCDAIIAECGHRCTGKCGKCRKDGNHARCDVEVSKRMPRCGHVVKVPCHEATDPTTLCPEPCSASLACGHGCSGTCGSCGRHKSWASHKCDKTCDRVLLCGHRCKDDCAKECPPCPLKCERRCPHTSCAKVKKHNCGDCTAHCKMPCTWACEHKKCTMTCADDCDRHPCEEPCRRRLVCGHMCLGLCGEECPKVCFACTGKRPDVTHYFREFDDDTELVGHYTGVQQQETEEDAVDVRFVPLAQLPCQCVFVASEVEEYLCVKIAPNKHGVVSVTPPVCPNTHCGKPIYYYPRVAGLKGAWRRVQQVRDNCKNSAKVRLQRLERVLHGMKECLVSCCAGDVSEERKRLDSLGLMDRAKQPRLPARGKARAVREQQRDIAERQHALEKAADAATDVLRGAVLPHAARFVDVLLVPFIRLLTTSRPPLDSVVALALQGDVLATAASFYTSLPSMPSGCSVSPWAKETFAVDGPSCHLVRLVGPSATCPSVDEMKQFASTANFALLHQRYCVVAHCATQTVPRHQGPTVDLPAITQKLKDAARDFQTQWAAKLYADSTAEVSKLEQHYKQGAVFRHEMQAIMGAHADFGAGHWFQCQNGHLYVIGDCGGAMVEAKCPECDARIGGGSHALRNDNAFADVMGTGAGPRWPQGHLGM